MRVATLAAVVVACGAAVAAHAAIDVLGDAALRHDAYDDVAHASRALLGAPLAAVALALLGFIVALGRRQARHHGAPLRGLLQALAPRSVRGFSLQVALSAPLGVLLMGALDLSLAGHAPGDLGECLAGAPAFALAVALAVGAGCGALVAAALRTLARAEFALVRALGGGHQLPRLRLRPHAHRAVAVAVTSGARRAPLARRRAGRAPPPPTH